MKDPKRFLLNWVQVIPVKPFSKAVAGEAGVSFFSITWFWLLLLSSRRQLEDASPSHYLYRWNWMLLSQRVGLGGGNKPSTAFDDGWFWNRRKLHRSSTVLMSCTDVLSWGLFVFMQDQNIQILLNVICRKRKLWISSLGCTVEIKKVIDGYRWSRRSPLQVHLRKIGQEREMVAYQFIIQSLVWSYRVFRKVPNISSVCALS